MIDTNCYKAFAKFQYNFVPKYHTPYQPMRSPHYTYQLLSIRVHLILWIICGTIALIHTQESQAEITKNTVVFLGDSLTEGYRLQASAAYPAHVERVLKQKGYSVKVINSGISGSTSASAVGRMAWLIRAKPTHLVLALGANDGLRGQLLINLYNNLNKSIEIAQNQGIVVILAGMKIPPNYGIEYAKDFYQVFEKIAKTKKIPFIPFLLDGVAGIAELNLEDGIHPNAKGHIIISQTVLEYLEPQLQK